jgi:hypothetical protein
MDADQARAPGGVLATQPQGRPDHLGELGLIGRGARVIRRDRRRAALTEPGDEPPNGRARQPERRGDVTGLATPLPEPEHGLADG